MHLQKKDSCLFNSTLAVDGEENCAGAPAGGGGEGGAGGVASDGSGVCMSTESAKYRMVRIHVDQVDVNLLEPDILTNINVN